MDISLSAVSSERDVYQVKTVRDGIVTTDGPWLGLCTKGEACHLSGGFYNLFSPEHQYYYGARGHMSYKWLIEVSALVLDVVTSGQFFCHPHQFETHYLEALFLKPGNNFTDEPSLYGVRLKDY